MKKVCNKLKCLKLFTLLALVCHTVIQADGQQATPVDKGYAPVNGIKMYYEIYGNGEPIVLLHGAFYNIQLNWSELIPELSKTRKVIALEFQGHGHSPYYDRQLAIESLANDVEGAMRYLKVDSADIAGYSMGGSIAYHFAINYPTRLKKLIIISSTHKTNGWLPLVNKGLDNFKPEFFDNTPLKATYDAVAPDKTKWRKFLHQMFDFARESFDCGDSNIAKIRAPVLLIAGDNDGLDKIELVKTYQLLGGGVTADLESMPKSQLAMVPSQGHVSLMMQTKTIAGLMNEFLQ